ncbi:MAG: spore maturation protein [Clostridiales bacterium]|nr:spore maturation protein [Clostridiales bacterium]
MSFFIPFIILFILVYGQICGIKVYDSFIEGAKEGMNITVRIFPYIIAMLLAVSMLRVSGCLDMIIFVLRPLVKILRVPEELLPLIIMKPLSGSGSLGVLADTLKKVGVDSLIGIIAATIMSSTETIFYTITVYYGSIGVKNIRHTLISALIADLAGIATAILVCKKFFG